MNRHDVLYNRGREVLNCRVQRVWYSLNPYLERSYRIDDGSKFDVPSSKFVEPLQSVVLCENYFEDKPADWQEVSIESFWDFLYSDCWSHTYSLRVLEGELLEWIIFTLNMWQKEKKIVTHDTFVFARNKREIRSCYKTGKTDQVYGHFEEILFIDFKYFGRNTRPQTPQTDRCSTIYPVSSVSFTLPGGTSEELLSSEQRGGTESSPEKPHSSRRESAKMMKKVHGYILYNDNLLPRILPRFSDETKEVSPETISVKEVCESSGTSSMSVSSTSASSEEKSLAFSDPIYIESEDLFNEGPVEDSKSQHALGEEFYLSQKFDKLPKISSSSSEYFKLRKAELQNERKQKKIELTQLTTKRTFKPSLPQVELLDDSEKAPFIRLLKGVPTFHEFLRLLEEDNRYDPRFKKLKQKKKKIKKRYQLDKKTSSHVKIEGSETQLHQASKTNFNLTNQGRDLPSDFQKRRLTRIPSNVSATSDSSRSRKRRESAPSSMIGASLRQRRFAEEVVGVTECEPFREPILRTGLNGTHEDTTDSYQIENSSLLGAQDSDPSALPSDASAIGSIYSGTSPSTLRPSFQKRPLSSIGETRSEYEQQISRRSRIFKTPNIIVTSESGEDLECEISEGVSHFKAPAISNVTGPTTIITPHPPEYFFDSRRTADTPSDEVDQLDTTAEEPPEAYSAPKTQSQSMSRSSFSLGRRSTRRRSSIMDESPDVYSDDEEDIPLHGVSPCFNTLKLNTWYSIEKLRGKDFYKKKPAFMEVLEKYRQLHRAVQAFKKPDKKGGDTKSGGGMLRRLTLMIKEGRTLEEIMYGPKEEYNVGKLKYFAFLKKKSKDFLGNRFSQRPVDFGTFSISDFHDKLMRALDDFVVRQEHVVSSQNFQSVTTITFTRPNVFKKYKM